MPDLQLSTIKTDFDYFKTRIQQYLSSNAAWGNIVGSPVADAAIDVLASIATLDSLKIIRATQETSRQTALSANTIYAIASEQGLRLTRKTPAKCVVQLSNTDSTYKIIPAYSTFEYAGTYFFNRDNITINSSSSLAVTLYEGQVITNTSYGLGEDYSAFVTPENAFVVSDTDVTVEINGTAIKRLTDGLWVAGSVPAFQDTTLPDGRALVQFGNSYNGYKPSAQDVVVIKYVITKGLDGNSIDILGKKVNYVDDVLVSGVVQTTLTGGASQASALKYKNLPTPAFGTFSTAVTRSQYVSTALEYPGVIDAFTVSQREANPFALAWMNLVKVYLLTDTTWTSSEKTTFIKYLEDRSGYTTRLILDTPDEQVVNVAANVSCYTWANLAQVKTDVETAITSLLESRAGIIGYDIYRSDIANTIRQANSGIEFFDVVSPNFDVVVKNKQLDAPTYLVSPGTGVLPAGTYYYSVTADVGLGQVSPANYATVDVTSTGSSVALAWSPVAGALGYTVYGRTELGQGVLFTAGPSTYAFTDDGSAAVGAAPPAQSELPVKYPKLGTLDIVVNYSSRSR